MLKQIITKKKKLNDKLSYYCAYLFTDKFLKIRNSFLKVNFFSENEVFIFILSGGVNKRRVSYLFQYFKNKRIDFVFYSDYSDVKNNVIRASYSKTYSSGELKHLNILNFIASNLSLFESYKYFLFIDDDTFINIDQLNLSIKKNTFKNDLIYGQLLDSSTNPDNPLFMRFPKLKYLSGGAGYLVPIKIFKNKKKFTNFFTGYSDSSFGLNVDESVIINSDLFRSQNHDYYQIDKSKIWEYISFHYIKSEVMYEGYIEACKTED